MPPMPPIAEESWRALGTTVHVLVRDAAALGATAVVHDLLDHVDATYSRFREDSELTRLNNSAGRLTRVSPLLYEAIETAVHVARATGGAVDPSIGHRLRLLGYDRDFDALPASGAAPSLVVERVPGWETIELDPVARSVRIPVGVSLDLGSSGKALAADRAAAAVFAATGSGVLVSLGGDLAIAGPAPDGGWRVACAEDHRLAPAAVDEVIALESGAVATSSTTVRRWAAGGTVRHHIVDPATGHPADGPWRSATVVAGTCVDANAASTAAIVLGGRAVAWLEAAGLPARLTDVDGRVSRIGGWPELLARIA